MRRSERQTTSRIRLGPILLVAFVVVPLAEIAVLIPVAGWLGLMPTLALIVLTAVGFITDAAARPGPWIVTRTSAGPAGSPWILCR
jgi:hypothetical protein